MRQVRLFWSAVVVATLGATLGVIAPVIDPPLALAAPAAGGLGYVPLATPCRVVDTRVSGGVLDTNESRSVQVAGSGVQFLAQGGYPDGCGIPDGVGAAELSVSAVTPAGTGYLRIGPHDGSEPSATFLAYNSGVGITNTGTVPLNLANPLDVTVKNFVGATQVVIDVQGYYTAGLGVGYVPLATPCRVVDTRVAGGIIGAGWLRAFQVAGFGVNFAGQGGTSDGCGIPPGVTAAEVSVTAVVPAGIGYVRIAPNNGTAPNATFLTYSSGIGITNTGTVTMSAAGDSRDVMVRNFVGGTQLVIDVQGYFPAAGGTRYQTVTPCRIADTRTFGGEFGANVTRSLQVGGTRVGFIAQGATNPAGCGVPQGAAAVEASLTAVAPRADGYSRVSPAGSSSPNATFLAYSTGRNITNTGTIGLARSGLKDLIIKNLAASTQYVLDVLGYFEAPVFYPLSAEQISTGDSHSCQLRSLGTATCWGTNANGQLGDGSQIAKTTPSDVSGLFGAVQIAAGGEHTCALLADGTIKCWGYNAYGQLGDNSTLRKSVPTTVTGLSGAVQLAVGDSHSCALLALGTVKCWGANFYGGIGDNTTAQKLVPTSVTGLSGAVQIAAGGDSTCALLSNGTAQCWGLNAFGQLGDNSTISKLVPTPVSGLAGAAQIAVGGIHSCALMSDGAARCWGANFSGQLGDSTLVRKLVPSAVSTLTAATQVSAGSQHTCAVLADSSTRCWGYGADGELGNNSMVNQAVPVTVLGLDSAVQVSAGGLHTCALVADGRGGCWGDSTEGQLGNGTKTTRYLPSVISGAINAIQIVAGQDHSCALFAVGTVKCWGGNTFGQLGDSTVVEKLSPISVPGLTGVIQISGRANHTCALLADGTAKCWGANSSGQLGDNTTANKLEPTTVSGLSGAVQISAGTNHTCARLANGTAKCWGG